MNIAYFAVISCEEFLQTNAVAVVRSELKNALKFVRNLRRKRWAISVVPSHS